MSRFIFLLMCLNFYSSIGASNQKDKDWCIKKCEEWVSLNQFCSNENYEIIKDQSLISEKNSERKTLKIRLPNGLQTLLISDPSLHEAAASISVEAGTWDDPNEYLGMAHFVEHLLFLGTEAYPKESEYSQYILERGGQYNAFTKHDRTTYGFSIQPSSFSGALDRLSHFFIDPLFTYSAIQREIHAVHHEFEDSIENDSLRVWRVLKERGNPTHPNVKLSCGNFESLSQVKRNDIIQWVNSYYHPKGMRLVLMSPEPLDSLVEKAHHFFSSISSKGGKEKKQERGELSSFEQKGSLTHIKPSFKNRSLFLMWEIPSFFLTLENSKAIHMLQMALDHGCSNSLSKILERESLAKEVHVDFWKMTQEHALFIINVILTDEGIAQYEEVISRCFQALNRIKELGVPEHLLRRMQNIEKRALHNYFDSSFDYVMKVSSELLDEEIETYPDKTTTVTPNSHAKINSFLSELNAFRCLYFLIASPEEAGVKLSRIEKWMGSEYFIRKIPEDKLHKWNEEMPHPLIGFQPEEEILLPKKDSEFIENEIDDKDVVDSVFIIDNEKGKIRWLEASSGMDSVDAFFCIASPLIGTSSKNTALNEIFIQGLKEVFNKELSSDEGFAWNLEVEGADLCLFFSVPRNECLENFRRCFLILKNSKVSREQFERAKKAKLDIYSGDPPPIDYAHQILDSFLRPFYYTKMELYHTLLQLTFEEYERYEEKYFSQVFLEGAFLGGSSKEESLQIWEEISEVLDSKSYNSNKDRFKQFVFPEDAQAYLVMEKTHRRANALLLLIEVGESTKEMLAIHKILTIVLQSEFFEELRTRQQTSYKLYTWNELMNQKICHCFALQSSTYTALDLLYRVERFLSDFSGSFKELLSHERFEVIRNTLIINEKIQKKSTEKSEDIIFIDESMESLRLLTYEKMIRVVEGVFSEENRKRIAILIEGSHQTVSTTENFYGIPYIPIEKEKFHK